MELRHFGKFLAFICFLLFVSCSAVPQRKRGNLADPVMQLHDDKTEGSLEGHNLPRREGSTGGGSGAGGGCGC